MANFKFTLTPEVIDRNSEGSLDTSVSGGVSYQRTGYIDVYNENSDRKIVAVDDGETFTDTIGVWNEDEEVIDQ